MHMRMHAPHALLIGIGVDTAFQLMTPLRRAPVAAAGVPPVRTPDDSAAKAAAAQSLAKLLSGV